MKTSVIIADGTFPCATAPLQGPYEETIRMAAQIGYDAVQLTLNRPSEVDPSRILNLAAHYGVKVSALATGRGYTVDGLSLGCGEEGGRKRAVERMKAHVDLAKKLGGARVIIGAIRGWTKDAPSRAEYFDSFHRSIRELTDYAESRGIVLILEANDHLETDAYIRIRETADYIRSVNSPSLKLQLDTMHMLYEGEEIYHQILECKDLIYQVDISGEERSCPDGNRFDYPLLIQALKEIGYERYLAFEYRPEPPKKAAETGYEYIRSLIGAPQFSHTDSISL